MSLPLTPLFLPLPHPPFLPLPHPPFLPLFVPSSSHILAIESYYGMTGPGIAAAVLYNPADPSGASGLVIDHQGRVAPVLEARWREFERAVAGAREEVRGGHAGWWSRPQNMTCQPDMTYDLGPADDGELTRVHLTGHAISARYGYPDDVQWHTPAGAVLTRDVVPAPFLELERQLAALRTDLFPPDPPYDWDWVATPVAKELRPMLRAIVRMAGIRAGLSLGYIAHGADGLNVGFEQLCSTLTRRLGLTR
ncbi:hypothetical protein DFH09DRAFT_1414082 [Mycena vulgaris]|nr:hypothetical protein DFH09DRAFT_1414082 [Mycena vulgaris]